MDDVLGKLTELIVETGLRSAGHGRLRLPAERDLAGRLGVQRSTVRERLATLEHLGVLERTQGSGTYVSLLNSDFIRMYFDLALALGYISTDEIEATRELLEREIARLAAEIASDDDIVALAAICQRMEQVGVPEQCLAADYQFHMKLAHATRNLVITLIAEGLSSVLRRVLARRRYMVRSLPDAAAQQNATHMPIVEALRRRDPDGAMAAMDEHFRVTNELQRKVTAAFLSSSTATATDGPLRSGKHKRGGTATRKRPPARKGGMRGEEDRDATVVPARSPRHR